MPRLAVSALLLCLLISPGAYGQSAPDASSSSGLASPLSSPKEPPAKTYFFLYDQGDHLRELVEAAQFEQASTLYSQHKDDFFSSRREKFAAVVSDLVVGLDATYERAFAQARETIRQLASNDEAGWAAAKQILASAQRLIDAFLALSAVKDVPSLPKNAAELSKTIETAKSQLTEQAPAQFARFDTKRDFFAAYPIEITDRAQVLDKAVPEMLDIFRAMGQEGVLSFAKAYKSALTSSKALPLLSNLYVELAFRSAGPTERLRLAGKVLSEANEAGLRPNQLAGVRIAFVEATSQTLLREGQIEFPVSVEVNLPFDVKKTDLENALQTGNSEVDYVIVLDISVARTLQRATKREEVTSQFQSGTREKPNPAYEQARMAVYQAQSQLSSHQAQYCYGYGCIGKAIGAGILGSRLEERQREFAATPMTIVEVVYTDYKFSASDVVARKAVSANYYVIDLASRTYFKSVFDVAEEKSFRIAYRLHDKDKDLAQHLRTHNSEADIKAFNDAPSSVRLSDVLDQYVRNPGQAQPLSDIVAMRQVLLADKNAALASYKETSRLQSATSANDARFSSVVVVHNPNGKIGAGFFVESDLVLTNYHVVEGSQFVEMKLHSGLETFGKVVKTDVRLDLALVKVQARGTPVTFFDGPVPLGSTVEAIGHPAGLNFSVTRGVVSAVRKRPALSGVGGKEVTFVQTDTPINPGNSGGPLFLEGKVVGVNDFKYTAKGIEGISFSIHFTEVQEFLKATF